MAKSSAKIFLFHGDCDFYIFKELKELKKRLKDSGSQVREFFGSEIESFGQIQFALESSDLFQESNTIILRDLSNGKSFYSFVEELVEYLAKTTLENNHLFIFNPGKVIKTSRIYKTIDKFGEIKELAQPKAEELVSNIKKSLKINDDAARLLVEFSNGNLFQISNEIIKLRNFVISSQKAEIVISDIEELCVRQTSQNEVWGIGGKFLSFKLNVFAQEPSNKLETASEEKVLLKELDEMLTNNIPPMQILYSFYQYVLNAIKLKQMIKKGKNFRECMALGYFFVKEFYDKRNQMDIDYLFKLNSEILDLEYKIKTGQIDEVLGMKRLVLMKQL